jgi:solute:Na+ symporter, SSS family
MDIMTIRYLVIAVYALMIITVGIMGMRKTKSFNDFFLGGGNVGPWMSAFSYGTAYFSAVLFIGFAGKIGWGFGYSSMWIGIVNALVGVLMVWGLMGWKIKTVSIRMQVATMSEYLEKRYDSRMFKLLASLVIFVFMIPYSAAVFMGLSYLFTSNFNVEYWQALIFMGTFTAIYIVLGGYKSMAIIDMIFGVIMAIGVIVLLVFTLQHGGGLSGITESLNSQDPGLTQAIGPPGFWSLFSLIFLTSIAPLAMPQLVQKFYAIRDRKSVKIGMFASTAFALLIGGVAYFVGSTTRIFLNPQTTPNAFSASGAPLPDRLMPELLTQIIPESLSVVILLLILSASMSTLAALVLISSSSVSKDVYQGFINPKVSDSKLTMLMRVMSAFFVVLSVLLAYSEIDSIVAILGISWGALGSFFLGPFIYGLFVPRTSRLAAYTAAILGLATCMTLYFLKIPGIDSPQAGTIGMMVSLIIPAIFLAIKR